jgi:hypothetical protein
MALGSSAYGSSEMPNSTPLDLATLQTQDVKTNPLRAP